MKVISVKTKIVKENEISAWDLIAESVSEMKEGSVVAISSKVVSLCEGSLVPTGEISKEELIKKSADKYLEKNKYDVYITIKNNILIPSAGIDESNTNGNFVLWPDDPQKSANIIWENLRKKFGIKNLGLIITDSTSAPLRWGITGKCIAHCGFKALSKKIGKEDLFGHELRSTYVNMADSLAASAVLCMGETNEQTPVALIEDVPFIEFSNEVPSREELDFLKINIDDDMYAELLKNVNWKTTKNPAL